MKRFVQGLTQGIYDAINNIEMYQGQVQREDIEALVNSWMCSLINKVAVFLGAVFIYFFFKFRDVDLTRVFQTFFVFWLVWVVQDNHIKKLHVFLHEHKKENK